MLAVVTRSALAARPSCHLRVAGAAANLGEKGNGRSATLVAAVFGVKGPVSGQKGRLAISASQTN